MGCWWAQEMPHEGVDEGAGWGGRGRMDHEVRLLIDDNYLVVFEQNIQRYVFGQNVTAWWRWKVNNDMVASSKFGCRLWYLPVQRYTLSPYQSG